MSQEELQDYIDKLKTAIEYEKDQDWTPDSRWGYTEGLKRALELLTK